MSINIEITGRLSKDPELKYTQSGKAVAEVTVVSNEYRRVEGEFKQDGEGIFKTVTFWEDEAELIAKEYHKGDNVIVLGKLRGRKAEINGETRNFEDVVFPKIAKVFRAYKNSNQDSGYHNPSPAPQQSNFAPEPPASEDTPF